MVQTPFLVFTNILFILFLLLYTRPAFLTGNFSPSKTRITLFLCFVFCLFSFWGADWFGYYSYFQMSRIEGTDRIAMEDFYLWLLNNICHSYLQFRIIIWGVALLFFYLTIKRLQLNIGIALFFFCSIYLIIFSYARVSLAISMMCYGFSLFLGKNGRTNFFHVLIGVSFIVLSFFLHKSAILGIAAIVATFVLMKFKRTGVILVLLAFPLVIYLMNNFFAEYFFELAEGEEGILSTYAQAGSGHLEAKGNAFSIGGFIQKNILEQGPYYLLAFCCFREIRRPSVIYPKSIISFITLLFVIVISSLIFVFDFGINTSTLFGRYLRFAQVPACIVLTYMYSNGIQKKMIKLVYSIGIFGVLYSLIYVLYNAYVSVGSLW